MKKPLHPTRIPWFRFVRQKQRIVLNSETRHGSRWTFVPAARNQELDSRALRIEGWGGVEFEGGTGPEGERRDSPDDENHRNESDESFLSHHDSNSEVKSGFLR